MIPHLWTPFLPHAAALGHFIFLSKQPHAPQRLIFHSSFLNPAIQSLTLKSFSHFLNSLTGSPLLHFLMFFLLLFQLIIILILPFLVLVLLFFLYIISLLLLVFLSTIQQPFVSSSTFSPPVPRLLTPPKTAITFYLYFYPIPSSPNLSLPFLLSIPIALSLHSKHAKGRKTSTHATGKEKWAVKIRSLFI